MNTRRLVAVAMALSLSGCAGSAQLNADTSDDVRQVLDTQILDWNRGDVDAFMQGYWRDANVRFASGGDVTTGFDTVLENYQRRYPNRAAMGELHTTDLDITSLGSDAAMAFGRWIVSAGGRDYCGLFTLILQRIDGRFVVIHDHTSSATEPMKDGRTCADIKAAL